jgi:hypothetical protein
MTKHRDFARLERDWGIHSLANDWLPDEFRGDFSGALDAQPALVGTASGGIPSWLTNYMSPEVVRVLQAPNEGANILGERKTGNWTTRSVTFTVIENTGEVSAYGDHNTNGRSNANVTFPQRQSFDFQTIVDIGDKEIQYAGEAKLNWVQEQNTSAALTLDKFMDYTYHFGVANLQNYGLLNDPSLPAAVTPVTKTIGGTSWGTNGAYAAPTEILNDFQVLFNDLVTRTFGRVKTNDSLTFACSPSREAALVSTNSFGISAMDTIKKAYPNLKVKTSPRYTVSGVENAQLIADKYDGKGPGYCSFAVKMMDHPIVRQVSSYQQKKTAASWGAIITAPIAISTITGI